jgi:outer membrane immunogenic protein
VVVTMKSVFLAIGGFVLIAPSVTARADGPTDRSGYQPTLSWSGCYVGVHVGSGWGADSWNEPPPDVREFASHRLSGWLGGGQIGCDVQRGSWVFGAEAQVSWANIDGSSAMPAHERQVGVPSLGPITLSSRVDSLGTITGRVGYTSGMYLFYAKGGAAWARDRFSGTEGSAFFIDEAQVRWGWTIGGGLEYRLSGNWSVRAEYNFLDFGMRNVTSTDLIFGPPFVTSADIDQYIHTATIGINYRF